MRLRLTDMESFVPSFCPSPAGRKFPVSGGIPNLLLQEDEC
jgi:uncharacterized protein YbaR (Trm112 family)